MNLLFAQILVVIGSLLSLHPLHVSVTEITFDEKEKELEIMMRVFSDDLETTLRESMNNPGLDVLNPNSSAALDQMVTSYLSKHFSVKLDTKLQATKYIGHEIDGDAFIFYVGVSNVKKWKTIEVNNNILFEMFEDQSNLVHVTVRDEVKSLRLTTEQPFGKLSFGE